MSFMKKGMSIFLLCTFLSFAIFIIPVNAQPKTFKQGFYKTEDLNLSKGSHTIQNNSSADYAFIVIFDSNQITRQFMRLSPQSKKYILAPLDTEYEIIISTNDSVTID